MLHLVVFCFVLMAVVHGDKTWSDDDAKALHAALQPTLSTCLEKFGLSLAEFEALREKENVDPCLAACIFKGTGTIDDKGKYDKDTSFAFLKKAGISEDGLKQAQEYEKICEKVNDENVSDGAEGCERAALIKSCFKEAVVDFM